MKTHKDVTQQHDLKSTQK